MIRPPTFISAIVTPATNYNLIELGTLKTLLGVTTTASDPYFTLLIPQASAAAQRYCNNAFVVETIKDQFWPGSDGWPWTVKSRTAPLQLSRWPTIAISSVTETIGGVVTTLTQDVDFIVDFENGQLTRLDTYSSSAPSAPRPCFWRENPVVAIYSAGYATVPADVADAVALIVKGKFYAQSRDPTIRSQNAEGIYSAQYVMGTGPGGQDDMPADASAKLARYRVPVVA